MSTTPDDRIRAHYKALRKGSRRYGAEWNGKSSILMQLARRWKKPIREIRVIISQGKTS